MLEVSRRMELVTGHIRIGIEPELSDLKEGPITKTDPIPSDSESECDNINSDELLPPLPYRCNHSDSISFSIENSSVESLTKLEPKVKDTLKNLSAALEIGIDSTLKKHDSSTSISSPNSIIFNSNIFENTSISSNNNSSILDNSSMISSSPKIGTKTKKSLFSISTSRNNSRSNSTTSHMNHLSPMDQSLQTRSRSLSNSNIFRRISLTNIASLRSNNEIEPCIPKPRENKEHKVREPHIKIEAVTDILELTCLKPMDFNNDSVLQMRYIQQLSELQKKDDLIYEMILQKYSRNKWYSKEELNVLVLQRVKVNKLWAKKIIYYQNL